MSRKGAEAQSFDAEYYALLRDTDFHLLQKKMSTILIAGGSGLVGSRLSEMLRERGHVVRILTRRPQTAVLRNDNPQPPAQFAWNPAEGTMDDTALLGTDVVINLAGAGIADGRWTAARKRELVESRVQSARTLRDAINRTGHRPQAYLSASAIGCYGDSGERLMHETDKPVGEGFMIECCHQWEQVAAEVAALGIRTVVLRISVVMAQEGGALAEFVKPLRFGLGAYFGNGRAWYSWIHRDDLCRIFMWAMENPSVSGLPAEASLSAEAWQTGAKEGVYNAVAPHPARNSDLVRAAAKAMRQWAIFVPAPAFVMRLIFGEMSAVILNSNLVSADKLLAAGFQFQYPDLEGALGDIFS